MTFLEALAMIRDGSLVADLTEQNKDVIASAMLHKKKASITIKLTYEPNGDSALTIIPTITANEAKPTSGKAVLFADGGGNLHRRDPNQGDVEDYLRSKSSAANPGMEKAHGSA